MCRGSLQRILLAYGLPIDILSHRMPGLLSDLDLTKQIEDKGEYRERVQDLQLNLLHFQRKILDSKRNVILVLQGRCDQARY